MPMRHCCRARMNTPHVRFSTKKNTQTGKTERNQMNGSPVTNSRSSGLTQPREAAHTYTTAPTKFNTSSATAHRRAVRFHQFTSELSHDPPAALRNQAIVFKTPFGGILSEIEIYRQLSCCGDENRAYRYWANDARRFPPDPKFRGYHAHRRRDASV